MRDKWYSDNRDLVKWATLVHVASGQGLRSILQVPYWRPEGGYPHFNFKGERLAVTDKVWRFFRNINSITRLGPETGISIIVIDAEFKPDRRDAYVSEVRAKIQHLTRPLALFLDPDTGLQPKKCCPEHTAIGEIQALWSVLKPRDWLILYQHARRTSNWAESVAYQLSSLCDNTEVHIARSDDVGQDVAFLCVPKSLA